MSTGFYTAASGMLMQQRTLNVLSNNLVNQETPGYRAERLVSTTFEQEMLTRIENGNTGPIGKGAPIRILDEVTSTYGSGMFTETGRPYDIAINGEGYYTVQGADNLYLTRNGGFDVDEEGYLVLKGAGRVLGLNGPLRVGGSGFKVEADGSVYSQDGNLLGTLNIVVPAQPDLLRKMDNGLYAVPGNNAAGGGQTFVRPEGTTLVQNSLEKSNVDLNRELSLLMEAQRSFQACSTILKGIDQINQKAASQIGSL